MTPMAPTSNTTGATKPIARAIWRNCRHAFAQSHSPSRAADSFLRYVAIQAGRTLPIEPRPVALSIVAIGSAASMNRQ